MKTLIKLIITGVSSALVIGVFFKIVEQITGLAVYVLLLNVDYFPILKDWQISEMVEFLFHVFVSVILVMVLYWLLNRLGLAGKIYPYVIASILIGFTLFFTTAFSERTPDILDVAALNYWMAGHLVYGIIVGCCIVYMKTKKER